MSSFQGGGLLATGGCSPASWRMTSCCLGGNPVLRRNPPTSISQLFFSSFRPYFWHLFLCLQFHVPCPPCPLHLLWAIIWYPTSLSVVAQFSMQLVVCLVKKGHIPTPQICHQHHQRCMWRKIMPCGDKFILYPKCAHFSGKIVHFGENGTLKCKISTF